MPVDEQVLGFVCDLTSVEDVAVQEAIEEVARGLRIDNDHNRPLEHVRDLLGRWAGNATAAVAMTGEGGRYVAELRDGDIVRTMGDGARYAELCAGGIRVINPRAEVGGGRDPLLYGRQRQKLAAIEEADLASDIDRLLRGLEHPAHVHGDGGPGEIRRAIYKALTRFADPRAIDAVVRGVERDTSGALQGVIAMCVRQRALLVKLGALVAAKPELSDRLEEILEDLVLPPDAPAELRARIAAKRTPTPPADVSVAGDVDARLLAALTGQDDHAIGAAFTMLNAKPSPTHVPTLLAALAHPALAGSQKHTLGRRAELYVRLAPHEAGPVRAAFLAGLRNESKVVASKIEYVAWRQELLLAELPQHVLAAWTESPRDDRYVDRLVAIWREHATHVKAPADFPPELAKRVP